MLKQIKLIKWLISKNGNLYRLHNLTSLFPLPPSSVVNLFTTTAHTSSLRPESFTKNVNHWFNSLACADSFGFKTKMIPFVSSANAGQHVSYLYF